MSFHILFRRATLGFALLLMGATSLLAQAAQHIRLMDMYSFLPIVNAAYQYAGQAGTSDEQGRVALKYQVGAVLHLSHVNYGERTIGDDELKAALAIEVLYWEGKTHHLQPVTVIGLRPNHAPSDKVTLAYQDRMAHDATHILQQFPAFSSIQKSGNYGFDPVFRGFKYDQLNVVLNGAQSATAACPNRMDPPTSQMAPNMLERIEVLKGPHALRYGTGLGATLNFIPAPLRFTDSADVYGRVSGGYEGNGNVIRGESMVGLSGKRYDVGVFAAWSQGDDYRAGDDAMVAADFTRGSIGTNIGIQLNARQQLRASAMYNRARDADFPALPMDLRRDNTYMGSLRHDVRLGTGVLTSWNTTLYGAYVDHRMDNLLRNLNPRMMNADTDATTYNYGGRTEGVWTLTNRHIYAGMDVRIEGAEGIRSREFLLGPNAGKTFEDNAWQSGSIRKTGLFAEYHQHAGQYHVVLSGRAELNSSIPLDEAPEFVTVEPDTKATQWNPSVSVGASRGVGQAAKVGLWLGRAQRSGSLAERFINYFPIGQDPYELLGNPQIAPEVNYQADLTWEWKTEKTAVQVDVFAGYLQDYISSVIDTTLRPRITTSPGVRRYVNIDSAVKAGFEINWTQVLGVGLQQQLGAAYTYGRDVATDAALPEIAPLDVRYTLRGSYLKGRLQPEVTLRHVLEQARIATAFGETVTSAFTLLDVHVAYQISDHIRFSAGINNLLDAAYYEHLTRSVQGTSNRIYAPGRNGVMAFSVIF